MVDDELEVSRRERTFALILGAIVRQDLSGDIELAWRVAERFMVVTDRRDPPDDPVDQP